MGAGRHPWQGVFAGREKGRREGKGNVLEKQRMPRAVTGAQREAPPRPVAEDWIWMGTNLAPLREAWAWEGFGLSCGWDKSRPWRGCRHQWPSGHVPLRGWGCFMCWVHARSPPVGTGSPALLPLGAVSCCWVLSSARRCCREVALGGRLNKLCKNPHSRVALSLILLQSRLLLFTY